MEKKNDIEMKTDMETKEVEKNTDGVINGAFTPLEEDNDKKELEYDSTIDAPPTATKNTEHYSMIDEPLQTKTSKSSFLNNMSARYDKTANAVKRRSKLLKHIVLGVLGAGFLAFLIAACVLNFQRAIALLVITCVVVFFTCYDLLKKMFGKKIKNLLSPLGRCMKKNKRWITWVLSALVLIGLIVWLVLDTSKRPEQLISFGGVCTFVFLLFLMSKHHRAVSWRAVFWGLGLEFALGLFIIRTEPGYQAFNFLGAQIQIFLNYTTAGSRFVFGDTLIKEVFAFQALPIVVFFSCVMSVLYYIGIMQYVIVKISWLMQVTMGTTATETLSVAGNIFVGQTEAPLLIRPYLPDMTKSEIHAVMTGGFATIAGSVMGAYISFGIDPSSLIAASVMAAPCALALSKLTYPEVEESKFKNEEGVIIEKGEERTLLEAASNGASTSVGLVANIAANLIAFIALLEFVNAVFSWLGGMVDYPQLTLQLILSYIFMPVAFLMGVNWNEADMVGEMLGTKIILNEFVAYQKLAGYKTLRLEGLAEFIDGEKQWITERAEVITTFALCGFANISSIGIMLGGLSTIALGRKSDLAKLVVRALITGASVSFVNAAIAGILYTPRQVDCIGFFTQENAFNGTSHNLYECCQNIYGNAQIVDGTLSFGGVWENVASSALYMQNCCEYYNSILCG